MKHFNIPMKTKTKIKCIFTTLLLCMVMCMSLFALSTGVSAGILEEGLGTNIDNSPVSLNPQIFSALSSPYLSTNNDGGFNIQSEITSQSNNSTSVGFYNGHKYQRFDLNKSWAEAKRYCENIGGHLVTITSSSEQAWIHNKFIESNDYYWLGNYLVHKENGGLKWKWVTSESFNYSNWYQYEDEHMLYTRLRGIIFLCTGGSVTTGGHDYPANAGEWASVTAYNSDGTIHLETGFICEWENQSTAKPDTKPNNGNSSNSLWADPIDTSSGAHIMDLSYLTQYGNQTFSFDLSYDSSRLVEGEMGAGWYHNYEKRIELQDDGSLRYYTTPSTYIEFFEDETGDYRTIMPGKEDWTITRVMQGVHFYVDLGINGTELYYPSGKLRSMTSHTGESLVFIYDGQSMTMSESISGKSLTFHYNADGRIIQVSGATPMGAGTVQFTYDNSNHLTAITGPDNKTVSYTYDAEGHVLTGTDGDNVCYFTDTYDDTGRVIQQIDGESRTTAFDYAFLPTGGTKVTITDRNENIAVHTFDTQSRLVSSEDQDGIIKTYAYDTNGNIIEETDGNGNAIIRTYNEKGKVLTETDPLGGVTTYTYDNNQNLLCQENPDGGEASFTYSPSNKVTTSTDERGNITTYTYSIGQLIEKETVNGTDTYTYTTVRSILPLTPEVV